MEKERALILVTNDDGFESKGLWATVEAVLPLGEVLVVAPDRQWSGGGRAMPHHVTGRLLPDTRQVNGQPVKGYAVDASPALAAVHGIVELADRLPSLVVSGINYGANLSIEVTVSGTVGAALEASAFGIPALAVSQEMDKSYHLTGQDGVDYTAAIAFIRRFAQSLLTCARPYDVDVFNVNIPAGATPETPCRLTCLSRHRYFVPTAPERNKGRGRPGYAMIANPRQTEVGSDIWALLVDRVVSVTPLSLDLTSRVSLDAVNACLGGQLSFSEDMSWLSPYLPTPIPLRRKDQHYKADGLPVGA